MLIQAPGKRGEALHSKEPWPQDGGWFMERSKSLPVILQTLLGCTHSCWQPWDSGEKRRMKKRL